MALELAFPTTFSQRRAALIRANAVFIYGKLVESGVHPNVAKKSVEQLFYDGHDVGHRIAYDEGYEAGRDDVNFLDNDI